jgi:hypothetical protein
MANAFKTTIRFHASRKAITLKSIAISSVSLRILIAVLLLVAVISMAGYARAQPIPVPPPFPENNPEEARIAENDRNPPKIEVLTTELHEGKNVFRVRITDESSLTVREVKYVQDGQLKVDGLFRDQNDVYRALVDIKQPARIVVITAGDANGNLASTYEEYDVIKSDDIFAQIMDMLSRIPDYFRNFFGG